MTDATYQPDDQAPKRSKRLSADLPQNWLHDPKYWLLSSEAWRLHTHGLMWCIGRTDGEVPTEMLTLLLPGSDEDRSDALKELLTAKHWTPTSTGWRIQDWTDTQSTVKQINDGRRANATRQAQWRKRQAEQRAKQNGEPP